MQESFLQHVDTVEDEAMDVDDGLSHSVIDPASEERLRVAQLRRGASYHLLMLTRELIIY